MSNLFKMWEQRSWVAIVAVWMLYTVYKHGFSADLVEYSVVTIIFAWIITIFIVWFVGAMVIRLFRWAVTGE